MKIRFLKNVSLPADDGTNRMFTMGAGTIWDYKTTIGTKAEQESRERKLAAMLRNRWAEKAPVPGRPPKSAGSSFTN